MNGFCVCVCRKWPAMVQSRLFYEVARRESMQNRHIVGLRQTAVGGPRAQGAPQIGHATLQI